MQMIIKSKFSDVVLALGSTSVSNFSFHEDWQSSKYIVKKVKRRLRTTNNKDKN